MKVIAGWVALVLSVAAVAGAQSSPGAPDAEVWLTVLEHVVIPDTIRNWELDPKVSGLVLSDQTVPCELPVGERERLRWNAALEAAARGERVAPSELEPRAASKGEDLRVGPERVIPRSMVARCLTGERRALPRLTVKGALRLTWERASVVAKEFRASGTDRWARRHPGAAGVVQLAVPVYANDRSRAGVYYSALMNGLGGGGTFCMLTYEGAWKVLWEETVWIE